MCKSVGSAGFDETCGLLGICYGALSLISANIESLSTRYSCPAILFSERSTVAAITLKYAFTSVRYKLYLILNLTCHDIAIDS